MASPSKPAPLSSHFPLKAPIIIDGALATYLETLGADISGSLWSADILVKDAKVIQRAHLDYFRSGANIAITASYQASVAGLVGHLGISEEEAKGIVERSVDVARKAREEVYEERRRREKSEEKMGGDGITREMWIAGSVGPYGAWLADGSEYRGDYVVGKEALKDFHRGRIQALVRGGVDLLACETMPQVGEVEALVELLQEEFSDVEAWFSFTLRDGGHIADGTPLAAVVELLRPARQVVAVGVNCVADDVGLEALRVLKGLWGRDRGELVMYPNSGEKWNAGARGWEGKRTEGGELRGKAQEWWREGAGLVGGCCRTTPEDIGVMREALGGKKE